MAQWSSVREEHEGLMITNRFVRNATNCACTAENALHVGICWLSMFCAGCGTNVEDRNDTAHRSAKGEVITQVTTESLEDVATETLRKGLTITEVSEALLAKRIIPMVSSRSSGTSTFLYGSGRLADPVLFIEFEFNSQTEYRLAKWRVEK